MNKQCLYKIKVKGTKNSCYGVMKMTPSYLKEKVVTYEYGTDMEYTLIFEGDCKYCIDLKTSELFPYCDYLFELFDEIKRGEYDGLLNDYKYNVSLGYISEGLCCEIWCSMYANNDYTNRILTTNPHPNFIYRHYIKGLDIFDDCPDDILFKEEGSPRILTHKWFYYSAEASCSKVKFSSGRSYWYIGDYDIGDVVLVNGSNFENPGLVIEKSTLRKNPASAQILCKSKNGELFDAGYFVNLWESLPIKERRLYLFKLDLDIMMTKKAFLSMLEREWIKYLVEDDSASWNAFFEKYKKE